MSKVFIGLAAAVALAMLSFSGWVLMERLTEVKSVSGAGIIAVPVNTGGPFELTSGAGNSVTQEMFKGKYALVYFGYSFCPDVCPTALQTIAAGVRKLGEDGEKVAPVFISVDPGRDKPEHLAQYVELFHPNMTGLTGTEAQIKAITKKFRVYYAIRNDLAEEDYPVDHTSFTYLMDPDWTLIAVFRHDATADNIADALKKIL